MKTYHCVTFTLFQLNNTALAQIIVLPSPGSAEYNNVIKKIMTCHICLGKTVIMSTQQFSIKRKATKLIKVIP